MNSEDSDEDNESTNFYRVLFANAKKRWSDDVKHQPSNSHDPTSASCHNTTTTSSAVSKKISVVAAVAAEAGEDSLDSEEEDKDSAKDCSSESCESETKFYLNADTIPKLKAPGQNHQALQRKNQALRTARWVKKENQRKAGKFYKCALLDFNDTDMISIPTGADHHVRFVTV